MSEQPTEQPTQQQIANAKYEAFYNVGRILAAIISYHAWQDWLLVIVHGWLGWIYIVYYIIHWVGVFN